MGEYNELIEFLIVEFGLSKERAAEIVKRSEEDGLLTVPIWMN